VGCRQQLKDFVLRLDAGSSSTTVAVRNIDVSRNSTAARRQNADMELLTGSVD